MTLSERERRLARLSRIIAERDRLARLLAAESARVAELTAKLDRVREWIDRRGVSVSDRDDAYMAGYRDAQRHALHDAVDLRRILDADGGDHA